ncbi:right-handed parallel beta-helix repeat-containing protein [Streptomyces sp. NPDC126514]|uniref:choice-of-anchor Q domain-containing protein n=1 Tax=Streptomyces sp. NPDC126514 TaxID=3155210 RepID=UPI00331CC3CB
MSSQSTRILGALSAAAAVVVASVVAAPTAQAAGRAFYVSAVTGSDSNTGLSATQPFKTIQKAADQTLPGDTVLIMNGTYGDLTREGVLQITRSGAPGKPITYRPLPGHDPVIAPVTGWNGIVLVGASYINLTGLSVRGDSDNLTLEDAEVGSKPNGPAFNTNCIFIRKDKASGRTSHHVKIRNNHVWDCPGSGIGSDSADHLLIEKNRVHSTSWYTTFATSGISVLHPVDVDKSKSTKIIIRGNVVHDNETKVKWSNCGCYSDGNGIIVDDTLHLQDKGTPYQGRILVENNVSFDNGGSGIHAFSSSRVDIRHNTAYYNSRSSRMESYGNIFALKSKDVRILNNVSYVRPGEKTNTTDRNVDVTYDYNIYYGGLAPEAMGPHDVITDPKLVNPGTSPDADFRLQESSPAVDTGTRTDTSVDHEGTSRPQGSGWDRGAYEYAAR